MQVVASQGLLEDCLSLFLDALEFDASKDLLPIDPNDLKRCSAQDYLKRTVFPFLAQVRVLMID